MKSSFRLFRIAGIDIGVHYSWLFIFVLITWSLAEGIFKVFVPGYATYVYWIMGVLAALLLFLSVLLHELAHSLVAKSREMSVSSITLFILGGVSNLEEEPGQPMVEFSMAIVGPLTSFVLAVIFWGIASAINGTLLSPGALIGGTEIDTPLEAIIGYLGYINMLLAIFNLLPGFPLDGGRVLRSIIWSATGSLVRATNIAAFVGRLFGWGFIALGIFSVITGNLFGFVGGLWIAFIGWFLSSAADSSRKEVNLRELLGGKKVRDIMGTNPETVTPGTTVEEVVTGIFDQRHGRAVPVCSGGKLAGIVTISDVRGLPREKWTMTTVGEIMTRQPLYTISPDEEVNNALKMVAQHDVNQLLIERDGQCAGLLSRADILRYIQLLQDLGGDQRPPSTGLGA